MEVIHTLIDGLRKGSEQAYKELFERFFTPLHQLAFTYVMDEDVANDIVQDVFISIYEHVNLLQNVVNLDGYLRIAIRNRCLNYLRELDLEDKGKRLYYEEFVELEEISSNELETMLEQVTEILNTLPDSCRQICELRFREGLKIKEIADKLLLSENTVKVQLHRGVNKVREAFMKQQNSDCREQKVSDIAILTLFL